MLKRAIIGIGGVVCGVALLPSFVLGKRYGVKGMVSLGRGVGTLTALFNRDQAYYTSASIKGGNLGVPPAN